MNFKFLLLLFILALPLIGISQSISDNLGLSFGGTVKENSTILNSRFVFSKSGQFEWKPRIEEMGRSRVFVLFENDSLMSAVAIKDEKLIDVSEVYNNCLSALNQESYITSNDVFSAVLGSSNEQTFINNGVNVKIYLYKYGGYSFLGGAELRASVIVTYSLIE